ncbi:MAG: GNAT family N-acetyltransferase [Novosphingobium sp.]|nr:GNAT family N-acetyltransferase [Novosphingobium sp.]
MFIRSERLFLRPAWPEDWEELLALIADEDIVRNLARVPWPYGADQARDFAARAQDPRLPHFFVSTASNGKLVGSVGLGCDEDERTELGYWIARPHWGNGHAPEAARAVLRLARTLGHRRIVAGHFVDNPASGRVLAKIGFRPTGKVVSRYSLGRGRHVESVEYATDLGAASDCDGCDPQMVKRAA